MRRALGSAAFASLFVGLAGLPVAGAESAPASAPMVLEGLSRAEVLALLGEPDKVTRDKGSGGERLVYKLQRVGDGHLPAPDERLVDLPGVGRCVRRIPRPLEGYEEKVEFEPSGVTEDGHMQGGGMTRTESSTITFEDGKVPKGSAPRVDDEPAGPVRLFLTLGPDERVAAWTTKGGR